jgi:co-chaperonin GroES (HSP10)
MIIPMTYKVLVRPDELDRDPVYKSAQAAGILIHDSEAKEIAKMAMDSGVVVSIGPTAFKAYYSEAGVEPLNVLREGDRVGYAKYAGKAQVDPEDGIKYLLLADEDINCIIRD